MKIKRKKLITIIIIFLILFFTGIVIFRMTQNKNALTVTEKSYITNNTSNLININVVNDAPIFGNAGEGVFYDYLNSFKENYELKFNVITTSISNTSTGLSLTSSMNLPTNGKVFYADHYVLVSKDFRQISSVSGISGKVGILENSPEKVKNSGLEFEFFESDEKLFEAIDKDDISYIMVPENEYIDRIMEKLYSIVYNFSDIKIFYYLELGEDEILNSIMSKYYNIWIENGFWDSYNENEYALFTEKLKITEKELDVINNKTYTYGFVANEPYDMQVGMTYGGITREYLDRFSKFSGITFEYKSFGNTSKLYKEVQKNNIDLYMNYYDVSNENKIDSLNHLKISFIMNNKDNRSLTSLYAVGNQAIYAKANSLTYNYLKTSGYNVLEYKNTREAKKLLKNKNIIAMDYNNYLVFAKESNSNSTERFNITTDYTYNFVSPNDTMFNRLLTYYMMSLDENEITFSGLNNYNNTKKSGTLIYKITKYALILIVVILVVVFITYKLSKKVRIRKKIKKSDKMKYIDLLTSLKNRNFLSENLQVWNQNTIYPQAIIVIDLNGVQELNDTYGYIEGDKQIKGAANALIKTQLDNSEIIRSDGNEFTIYLVGYNEKQIISYIKKLYKEFKNLPYEKSAAIGFSMITDDIKLIDDAINEATEKMKENKELQARENDDEKENK